MHLGKERVVLEHREKLGWQRLGVAMADNIMQSGRGRNSSGRGSGGGGSRTASGLSTGGGGSSSGAITQSVDFGSLSRRQQASVLAQQGAAAAGQALRGAMRAERAIRTSPQAAAARQAVASGARRAGRRAIDDFRSLASNVRQRSRRSTGGGFG